MNAITRLSGRGQVVGLKGVRDLKGGAPGLDLEVVDVGDGVLHLVASVSARAFVTFDRRLARHAGTDAPLGIEMLA
ncbi:hypothetical protein [Sphingomonas phyllosphaerae]|uniref:hypothetical protein n=1 Tax=Sphingomonas phyllosphaerae TaxID=257003 RepID=UPI002413AF71|nr:hypothetical protein [Sphingomonas phyllosphaerae]